MAALRMSCNSSSSETIAGRVNWREGGRMGGGRGRRRGRGRERGGEDEDGWVSGRKEREG